jgi:hypothetical protein
MKTSRSRMVLSFLALTLAASPLAACSKSAGAAPSEEPAAVAEGPQNAPAAPPGDAPAASPNPGAPASGADDGAQARDARGRRGGKHARGKRADGQRGKRGPRAQRLRQILVDAGVPKDQIRTILQRLRAERQKGGAVRAENVFSDVLPKLTPAQRDELTEIVRDADDEHAAE